MRTTKTALALLSAATLGVAAGLAATRSPKGNRRVPEPARPVDLQRYLGVWFELARYENRFERNCEAATAQYSLRPDGMIKIVNSCHKNGLDGPISTATGRAKIVSNSAGAKLKVAFFGPFYGNYWVLDHDDHYHWSIVGEPSGRFLWILHREANPAMHIIQMLRRRVAELGYDTGLLRWTRQQ